MVVNDAQVQIWQQQIAAGDENAFNSLFRHLYLNLVHFSINITHSKPGAEEVVSDVFVKIWQQRQELGRIEKLRVFLFVAVKNQSYNYLRKNSNWSVELTEDNAAVLIQDGNPEDDLAFRELQLKLHKVIEQLPEQCRLVYKLVKEDGLKYKEVAEIMNLSPRTVETQVYRAVKKIREVLLPDQEERRENTDAQYTGNAVVLCLLLFS